jgi:hypothetical protein
VDEAPCQKKNSKIIFLSLPWVAVFFGFPTEKKVAMVDPLGLSILAFLV